MAELKIKSKGKIYTVYVDDEDLELISKYHWNIAKTGKNKVYYVVGYLKTDSYKNARNLFFMHRVILNPAKGLVVDHIDHNPLNNIKSNLRICTRSENMKNRRSAKGSTSKYLGVSKCNRKKPWRADIRYNSKFKCLGCFKTEEEAALAYNKAAQECHGEFANLNQIK